MKKYAKALLCLALIVTVICSFSSCFVLNAIPKKPQTENSKETVANPTGSNIPYTSGDAVNIGNTVYAITENALLAAKNGQIETLYEGKFKEYNTMVTNGEKIITVDFFGNVLYFDIRTKSVTTLFTVNPLYSICGANQNSIFMETKESEDEWWGSVVMSYDYKGNTKKEYGSGKLAEMYEGKLVITDFATDVRPVSLEIVDQNDTSVLNEDYVWSYRFLNDSIYYLNADRFNPETYQSDSISLIKFSNSEPKYINIYYSTDLEKDGTFATAGKEIFYIYADDSHAYYLETGETVAGHFGPYAVEDVGMDYAHDKNGIAYYTVMSGGNYQLYRAKGNNGYVHVYTFTEESYPNICAIIDDLVYYTTDTDFKCIKAPVN